MVLRPTYPDIDSERQVVIEEIAMYEDEPQDKVHDVLPAAVFGDHPLGRPIIGTADVIARRCRCRTSRPTTTAATRRRNIVVAAAGNVEHDASDRAAWPGPAGRRSGERQPARVGKRRRRAHAALPPEGRPSSTTSAWARPGLARGDDAALRAAGCSTPARRLELVAPVPGGAREARPGVLGLLVRRASTPTPGQVGVYVGTRPDNVARRWSVIGTELRSASQDDAGRRGRAAAGQGERQGAPGARRWSPRSTRMNRLGRSVLMGIAAAVARRDRGRRSTPSRSTTSPRWRASCRPERLSAAGVGGDEEVFRAALEAVSPALLAA